MLNLELRSLTLALRRLSLEPWGITPRAMAHPGSVEAHPGSMEAYLGAMEGHPGAVELTMEP
jgi:hypothetical protein